MFFNENDQQFSQEYKTINKWVACIIDQVFYLALYICYIVIAYRIYETEYSTIQIIWIIINLTLISEIELFSIMVFIYFRQQELVKINWIKVASKIIALSYFLTSIFIISFKIFC